MPDIATRRSHTDYTCANAHQCLPGAELCPSDKIYNSKKDANKCGDKTKCADDCCKPKVDSTPVQPNWTITSHALDTHVKSANKAQMENSVRTTVKTDWAKSCAVGDGSHNVAGSLFRPVTDTEYGWMMDGTDNKGSKRMDVWIATEANGITINHIGPWHGTTKQSQFEKMWTTC